MSGLSSRRSGGVIDDALVDIENENPRLKGLLDKRFARSEIGSKLVELVDLISTVGFSSNGHKSKDVLGEVYEYSSGSPRVPRGNAAGSSTRRRRS